MALISPSQGSLFDCGAEALVNPVNCVGVMGKGLARAFKELFPDNFLAYQVACRQGVVRPGKIFVHNNAARRPGEPRFILNFPTKRHWQDDSRIEDVQSALEDLVQVLRANAVSSVAIPAVGCGLGGLDWDSVRPLVVGTLASPSARLSSLQVHLFDPKGWKPAPARRSRAFEMVRAPF